MMSGTIGSATRGAVLATAVGAMLGATAPMPAAAQDAQAGATANAVSVEPTDPTYFGNFAPELPGTVARMPPIDPETGLHVAEIAPGLFAVTDGVYQSAFLVAGEGVAVFDAPPSFAQRLPDAIRRHAPGAAVSLLVYSHDHADHMGGAGVFAGIEGLEIVSSAAVADSLARDGFPGAPLPTSTFESARTLSFGGVEIQLRTAGFHSEDEDVIVYLPAQKFLMAVDTITPGEVPFMNFGATADFEGYLGMFDTLLEYDFTTLLTGHLAILATRQDLIDNRDYAFDVRDTVRQDMASLYPRFGALFEAMGRTNANLAYRAAIEQMRDACAAGIIERWSDRLSVVDVWADSHCETAVLHAIMH